MNDLSSFPVTHRWPAQFPEWLQLYSALTPNGVKVSVMLEEAGIPYEAHRVDIHAGDQFTPEFLSVNPNNKIPAILDPNGPGGEPLMLAESGAILVYLAEKSGQFLPLDAVARYRTLQWVMFQMGSVGPMFGQIGFFYRYGGKDFEDKRPLQRYVNEAHRLLKVLDVQLKGQPWLMGEQYTIADMAVLPWVRCLIENYDAAELVELGKFPHVLRVLAAWEKRPAVQRGLQMPPK